MHAEQGRQRAFLLFLTLSIGEMVYKGNVTAVAAFDDISVNSVVVVEHRIAASLKQHEARLSDEVRRPNDAEVVGDSGVFAS